MKSMGWRAIAILAAGLASACAAGSGPARGGPLRLNELQFIGTHNSYHIAPDRAVFDLMRATGYEESPIWTGPALEEALSFTHPPLARQLDMGLRVFELDVHDDPDGGRYAQPGFLAALGPDAAARLDPVDPAGVLRAPGMKVFHTADTDVRSRCLLFTDCLKAIRDWSDAHPGHLPIFIQIETKEGRKPVLADAYRPADPAPFTEPAWRRLHAEIGGVFGAERLFLPRDLRGRHASLNQAIRQEGWPRVSELRGKVIFLLLDSPEQQDAYVALIERGLEPILFPSRNPADPFTAWMIEPTPDRRTIRPLVEAGFLVYTRADADSAEPRRNDSARAAEALASGAQLISTDYPVARPDVGPYAVSFGGAYVRCNILLRRDACQEGGHSSEKYRE